MGIVLLICHVRYVYNSKRLGVITLIFLLFFLGYVMSRLSPTFTSMFCLFNWNGLAILTSTKRWYVIFI